MKRNLRVICGFMLIGMAAPALGQQTNLDGGEKTSSELHKKFTTAYNRQDAAELASLFTEDAVRVTPQGIIQGRDAIRADFERRFKAGGHDLTIETKFTRTSGNSIWDAGEWNAKFGDQSLRGYYALTLVPEGDEFKVRDDSFNVIPPVSAALPAHK